MKNAAHDKVPEEVASDQAQVKRTRRDSRPKLQGVEIRLRAQMYDQMMVQSGDGLIRGLFRPKI